EALVVDVAIPLARDLAGEVDRKTQGVVEEERVVTADVAAREHAVEELEAARERLAEPFFLATHDADHEIARLHDVGIRATHHRNRRVDERRGHGLVGAEEERVAYRAPDDAAQDVAALLVR